MKNNYLENIIKQFLYYKMLGEKTMAQLSDEQLVACFNESSNSISIIVKHLWGNMLSRWTDIFNTDGEKEWRKREEEFMNDIQTREELMLKWNEGWQCLLKTLEELKENDLDRIIYIRNKGHSVVEAINRQLTHYAYHIGQIVFIGKMLQGNQWISLSIPKGGTANYNETQFSKGKKREHFSDTFLNDEGSK